MWDERAWGLLYGLACGDALGWPVEFTKLAEIKRVYGPAGIQDLPEPAPWTDDTQMTLALVHALIEAGEADLETLMAAVTRQFVAWLNDPSTPQRAPGGACLAAARRLEAGTPWREAGVAHSKGCGSLMRVLPVGYVYQHDEARLREVADAQGLCTHAHPSARAACTGGAYLAKLALDNVPVEEWQERMRAFVGQVPPDFEDAFVRLERAFEWTDEETALAHIGKGWVAEESLALVLYCVRRYPDDYAACVRRAANTDGDSDSIACIAGGLMGARLGLKAIPPDWVARVEASDEIGQLAGALADKREGMRKTSLGKLGMI
ncbi:MAG: ADP-ribosylglycohydrolase family protein [Thermoflexales bacterium]|nr:ADP-ribosylglycohydrolase family protein [Thermoflexales bacterium]